MAQKHSLQTVTPSLTHTTAEGIDDVQSTCTYRRVWHTCVKSRYTGGPHNRRRGSCFLGVVMVKSRVIVAERSVQSARSSVAAILASSGEHRGRLHDTRYTLAHFFSESSSIPPQQDFAKDERRGTGEINEKIEGGTTRNVGGERGTKEMYTEGGSDLRCDRRCWNSTGKYEFFIFLIRNLLEFLLEEVGTTRN